MDKSNDLPLGIFLTSSDYGLLNKPNQVESSSKLREAHNAYLRSQSLQKLSCARQRITSTKAKFRVAELPELRRDSKSVRDVSASAQLKNRVQPPSKIKVITSSATLLARGSTKMLSNKMPRKGKRDSTVITTPCRTARHKDNRYDFESSLDPLQSTKHARAGSQLDVAPIQEDPYHYLNVAALGTSTAFKDILYSRNNNDSRLISSFDKLLKVKKSSMTSLNSSTRYMELSPLRSASRIDDGKESEGEWLSKRAAVMYSRELDFKLDYRTLLPTWEEHNSGIKPDRNRMLVIVNFEGVIGSFTKKDGRAVLQFRYQGLQALKYMQEYFDVVLLLSMIPAWRDLVCYQLSLHRVKLTAVYSYSPPSARASILNYTGIINSVSPHWRPTLVVSASNMSIDDLEDCSLYTSNGLGFKLNALNLPIAERIERTPVSLIVPHLRSEDPREVVSAFVFARSLYDLAYKTSSSIDWRRNFELLYNGREPALRCSYISHVRILKSDVLHELLIEEQSPPVSKQECPITRAKRPSFPLNFYGILRCGEFLKSQRGAVDEIEVFEELLSDLQL